MPRPPFPFLAASPCPAPSFLGMQRCPREARANPVNRLIDSPSRRIPSDSVPLGLPFPSVNLSPPLPSPSYPFISLFFIWEVSSRPIELPVLSWTLPLGCVRQFCTSVLKDGQMAPNGPFFLPVAFFGAAPVTELERSLSHTILLGNGPLFPVPTFYPMLPDCFPD